MRISTAYKFDSLTSAIDHANENMFNAQQQVSTGKTINKPSDNPSGMADVLTMSSIQNAIKQYNTNLQAANGVLTSTDSALSQINTIANSAYTLALSGANSATDQSARNGMATQITNMQQQLVSLANSQGPSGQYIFAGQKNSAAPYAAVAGVLNYSGDLNNIQVEVGPGQTIASTTQVSGTITTMYAQLEQLKNDLTSGNVSALTGVDVGNMQTSQQAITLARGDVGSRMQTVTNLTTQNQNRSDQLTKSISSIQDVDMAKAITNYQLAQTAYQAALSTANQGFSLSLMSYLGTPTP